MIGEDKIAQNLKSVSFSPLIVYKSELLYPPAIIKGSSKYSFIV
jgi:hypothetical protein